MVKTAIKADYSSVEEVDISLDTTLNEIQINKGGYEEVVIRLTEEQLQELFNQMADAGYNDKFMEKLWEKEEQLEETEEYVDYLKDRLSEVSGW